MTLNAQQRYDEQRLLRYRSGEPHARDRLVERFLPLAQSLARRYTRRAESLEDVEQVACLALIKAIDGFDTERGTAFSSYAVPSYRRGDQALLPRLGLVGAPAARHAGPRGQRRPRQRRHSARQRGSPATPAEIAEFLGVSVEAVVEAREAYRAMDCESPRPATSQPRGDDGGARLTSGHTRAADREIDGVCDRIALEALLDTLPDRERLVIQLYYQHDLTPAEIGERLGYVSRYTSRGSCGPP